jgi:hypothetical protein
MRPVSPAALLAELAGLAVSLVPRGALGRGWLRVGIDGADAARPGELADDLVAPIRLRGHEVIRVRADDHLRPASLRYEHGRTDPDSYYDDWWDTDGLRREVLEPLAPGGSGRIRTVRWDSAADRASRSDFQDTPPGAVTVLSGPFLLGRSLPLDLVIHLELTAAALARRTPEPLAWTLPAYARYDREVHPTALADVVVKLDDPRHPAVARVAVPGRAGGRR